MCKLGRGSVHEYVSIDEVASTGSAHSTRPEGTAGRVAVLGEDLNALLYGGEETTENCLESLIESGPSRSSLSEHSPPERPISLGKPTRQNTDYGGNDFVEDDIGEIKRQRGSRTRKRHSSPVALRSSASKMPRHIELPDSSSSDEEILIDSTNSTSHSNFMDAEHTSVPFATGTKTERPSGDAVRLNAATGIIASSSQNTAQSSKPIIRSSSCASTTQQQTSVADRLLFVKVVFMTDAGVRLKTKGIPFPSASRLCDVKARCKSEVEAEGEFQSLSLYDGDCELDDETPLELVAGCNKLVECRVFGWMPPSPAHLYATKSARLMSNIVRALGNALDGRLCVSEENVREDTAFIAALLAFAPRSLSAICIDGNEWSVELVEVIGKMAADLNELSMECCQLNSKGVRLLLETGRSYTQLTKLNMSFNDLSTSNVSDSIASLVHACPNISTLHLACCNLEHSTATQLVDVISECNHLKELDLSQNGSITAEHIARILSSCSKLKRLNVAATGVTEINAKVDVVSELSDINLSLCDLCDDPEALFDWLLKCCHEMASIDLRATNISYAQLETFCKRKGAKQPISTLKLAGCTAIESDVDAFVSLLKLLVTTDFAIKFDLGEEFKSKIIAALPESFVFCIA
ncbi:unnamed protein product [Toxocara canis]|uniref:Ubiquitin-like domain-containing protein n=1 Tax=Toxocara canis TaxID=6265 RepID=A0A183UXP7_TOXCA|nr:unnamed protein product [Toxocara canis]